MGCNATEGQKLKKYIEEIKESSPYCPKQYEIRNFSI